LTAVNLLVFFLSILLNIKKKFAIFNEVRIIAKKAFNKAIRNMITV